MDDIDNIDNNLQQALQSCLNDTQYDRVRTVGAAIAKGLTLHEACVISHVDIDKLLALSEKYKPVSDYISFKQTTFKATLIKQLSTQALNGDAKLATWFMERLYDEYNPRVKRGETQSDNLLVEGLEFIRKNGDKTPLTVKDIT
jgi:hypothetical protein